MRRFAFSIFAVVILSIFVGCATDDYHHANYYHRTFHRLETRTERSSCSREPEKIRAGVARVDITPPIGMPLQGFGARRGEPSIGVHDPLYARVLVLKTSHSQLVLVSCDLMAVTKNLTDTVFQKVTQKIPLQRNQFILFATHTHSGAGGLSNRFAMQFVGGRFRPKLFAQTTDKIANAILDAVGYTQPVQIAFGTQNVANINKNRSATHGSVDRELAVMRITNLDDKPIAWLVNFAAHPTIFGPSNFKFSADYPGYLARELEQEGAVCLFANGAAGDLTIRGTSRNYDGSREKPLGYMARSVRGASPEWAVTSERHSQMREEKAERVGKSLADSVRKISDTFHNEDVLQMEIIQIDVELPPVRIRVGNSPNWALPTWFGNSLFPRTVPVQLIRLNRNLLLAVPAELSSQIGIELKEKAKKLGYHLFVVGYANDYIGYVVSEQTYATGSYEARTSFYGSKLDDYLREIILKMFDVVKKTEE